MAMTRKPCLTRKEIQPGSRQLYLTLEAKPWIRSTGSLSPSLGPSSTKAMLTPSEEKLCMVLLSGVRPLASEPCIPLDRWRRGSDPIAAHDVATSRSHDFTSQSLRKL